MTFYKINNMSTGHVVCLSVSCEAGTQTAFQNLILSHIQRCLPGLTLNFPDQGREAEVTQAKGSLGR